MFKQKTYKQIEASRNRRLWITTVILPVGTIFVTLYNGNPDFRKEVNWKMYEAKMNMRSFGHKVKNFFSK